MKFSTPNIVKRTVPCRRPNADFRSREYLTPDEVDRLIETARKRSRHGHRDATLIMLAYRHGLRPSEACALLWEQVDFKQSLLHVTRIKNGTPSVHPLRGVELRALRKLKREEPQSSYLFISERRAPMTAGAFRKLFARFGITAEFPFPIHPHMLRHSAGYKLANDGHDTRSIQLYLGHSNIQNTVTYTKLSPSRFRSFWID